MLSSLLAILLVFCSLAASQRPQDPSSLTCTGTVSCYCEKSPSELLPTKKPAFQKKPADLSGKLVFTDIVPVEEGGEKDSPLDHESNSDERSEETTARSEVPAAFVSGGLGSLKEPDEHIKKIVGKLQDEIRGKACAKTVCHRHKGRSLRVKGYKVQSVAGTVYFAAVEVKRDVIFHVKIFEQSWAGVLEVLNVQGPKSIKDSIEYF